MPREVRQVYLFFAVTLFASYFLFWGPLAMFGIPAIGFNGGPRGPWWAILLFITGGFVPSLAGIVMTANLEGRPGLRSLFRSAARVRVGWPFFAKALGLVLFYAASLIGLIYAVGGSFDFSQFLVQAPTLLPLIILGPLSEEFGWRGFAQKRLSGKANPVVAGLAIGSVWGLWHLPLFYLVGTSQSASHLPFAAFFVAVAAGSLAYGYFWERSGGALFTAIFLHWIYTFTLQVIDSTVLRDGLYNWLECLPMLAAGILFAILLSRRPRKTA